MIRPGFAMRSRDLVNAWKEYTDILERENVAIPTGKEFLYFLPQLSRPEARKTDQFVCNRSWKKSNRKKVE